MSQKSTTINSMPQKLDTWPNIFLENSQNRVLINKDLTEVKHAYEAD